MAMRKTGQDDKSKVLDTVFRGREAQVFSDHMEKTGKVLGDFTDEERKAFEADLNEARRVELNEQNARESALDRTADEQDTAERVEEDESEERNR